MQLKTIVGFISCFWVGCALATPNDVQLTDKTNSESNAVASMPPINSSKYSAFQEFDRQFNIGYGMSQGTLKNGADELAGVTQSSINLEVERLFNNGVWFQVDGNIVVSSLNNQVNGVGSGNSVFNQQPNLGGINGKVGYAFVVIPDTILLTPYALIGRNTNLAASTVQNNNDANITNDFYYTGGLGGRLEYRINKTIDVYADELVAYNWDQSGPVGGIQPQNNMIFTTTLGAKFNVYKHLQLGINGFYSIYQAMASLPTDYTGTSIYAPFNCGYYGGMITVGLTY